jgi:hypothetical protein
LRSIAAGNCWPEALQLLLQSPENGPLFFFTRNHPVVLDGFAHLILVKL